eukprot:175065_1
MADDPNDWNKRLKALQNKGNPENINPNDLNNRLNNLQQYQKKDINPNATNDDLWNRLNNLDALNVNNDINPYQPAIQNKNKKAVQNSKLAEHKTDSLLNRMADEINLEKTVQNNDIDFDIDDELDDVDDDPELFAFMKQVENDINKKNTKPPTINQNWDKMLKNAETNAALTGNDEKLINDTMNEVPQDIIKASKQYADKEYKSYKQKEKLYAKMGKMGMDPDDYLDKIMGDSDGNNDSDSSCNDNRVNALINAAKDEVALEDKFGPVVTNEKKPKQNSNVKQKKKKNDDDDDEYWDSYADYDTPKKKKNDDDDDEYWDSYADYDTPKKKKKRRGWF